jgi:HPr kinase/phosphorylase
VASRPDLLGEEPSGLHASAVRLQGRGVLILGASGSGKSRLALALLQAHGGLSSPKSFPDDTLPSGHPGHAMPLEALPTGLVGDDRIILGSHDGRPTASPLPQGAGLIEARGMGILSMPWCERAPLHLCVELCQLLEMERLPDDPVLLVAGQPLAHIKVPLGDLAHQVMLVRLALALHVA